MLRVSVPWSDPIRSLETFCLLCCSTMYTDSYRYRSTIAEPMAYKRQPRSSAPSRAPHMQQQRIIMVSLKLSAG